MVQKLAVMGVTIVAASGDNGINTSSPSKIPSCPANPYVAQFPASSSYVLAVGATQGAESWAATGGSQQNGPSETVCQSDLGGTITSGGGFSTYYTAATAPWQANAVSTYFTNAAQAGKTPLSGYKVGYRGYPDVSLNGVNYQYYVGTAAYKGSGTSASTPGDPLTPSRALTRYIPPTIPSNTLPFMHYSHFSRGWVHYSHEQCSRRRRQTLVGLCQSTAVQCQHFCHQCQLCQQFL